MKNGTLEKAQKKARRIMNELEGEGMATLRALKLLLEREIENRLRAVPPPADEPPPAQGGGERVCAQLDRPLQKEAAT